MKKLLAVMAAGAILVIPGVALATGNHGEPEKQTICYKGETKQVEKRGIKFWLYKGATKGECKPKEEPPVVPPVTPPVTPPVEQPTTPTSPPVEQEVYNSFEGK